MGVNDLIKVGNNIKRLRKDKKMSQKDMAKILNIPCSTYSNYENNNREPSADLLKRVAKVLEVDINDLLGFHKDIVTDSENEKYLLEENDTISAIETLIHLCNFNIKFNKLMENDKDTTESLKLAIENNTIPLTYISNDHGNINLTNEEFTKFTDNILRFVKFELNKMISNRY